MPPNRFDHLLGLIAQIITKDDSTRATISPEERLAIMLRFLASEETKQAPSQYFQVGKSTVSIVFEEVCDAISNVCGKNVLLKSIIKWFVMFSKTTEKC